MGGGDLVSLFSFFSLRSQCISTHNKLDLKEELILYLFFYNFLEFKEKLASPDIAKCGASMEGRAEGDCRSKEDRATSTRTTRRKSKRRNAETCHRPRSIEV